MKRFLPLLIILLCMSVAATSCYRSDIDALQDEIDELKDDELSSISEQIEAIEQSLSDLESVTDGLDSYVAALQEQATSLEATLASTQDNLALLKEELAAIEAELDTELADTAVVLRTALAAQKASLIAELTALQTSLEKELESIYDSIESITSKDEELETRADSLEAYLSELKSLTDEAMEDVTTWAETTFSTLEQYTSLCDDIAALQAEIEAINLRIDSLTELIAEQLMSEIKGTIDSLVTAYLDANVDGSIADSISAKFDDITSSYTSAISSLESSIKSAYTSAIETAFADLETSMQTWVSEQLSSYYTIVETDSLLTLQKEAYIAELETSKIYIESLLEGLTSESSLRHSVHDSLINILTEQLAALSEQASSAETEITSQKDELSSLESELKTLYTAAIDSAFTTAGFAGELTSAIKEALSDLDSRIETACSTVTECIMSLNESLSTIESALAEIKESLSSVDSSISEIKAKIEAILEMVQSITYIPAYSDGMATVTESVCSLDFLLSPASTASAIVEVWSTALSASAAYEGSVESTELSVTSAEADDTGILSVTVDCSTLSDFLSGDANAFIRLNISSGYTSISSDYIGLYYSSGPVAVDLGLSCLWATYNVGAESVYDCGDHFAWGMTVSWEDSGVVTSVTSSADISGDSSYDAATAIWGSPWRTATSTEWAELTSSCTFACSVVNGVRGMTVTGTNGNSIFLPYAGMVSSSSVLNYEGTRLYYWTSTPYYRYYATSISATTLTSVSVSSGTFPCSIRPVRDN